MKPKPLTVSALIISLLILALFISGNGQTQAAQAQIAPMGPVLPHPADFSQLPLSFTPNAGQADPAARFEARGMGGAIFFTPEGLVLSLPANDQRPTATGLGPEPYQPHRSSVVRQSSVLRLRFEGANSAPEIRGIKPLPGVVHYFMGADPTLWRANLPTYAGIIYQQLYPGIDLRYDGADGGLKSTYLVAPGANPNLIRWRYEGATRVRIDDVTGNLLITVVTKQRSGEAEGQSGNSQSHIPHPTSQVIERAPIAWQEIEGRRVAVAVRYTTTDDGRVGFALGDHNPAYPLIIDPTLVYSTYLGGSGSDLSYDIALDNAHNIYITGETASTNFPTTTGAYDASFNGGTDAFVAKLNADGSDLLYSTYLGGSNFDYLVEFLSDRLSRLSIAARGQ